MKSTPAFDNNMIKNMSLGDIVASMNIANVRRPLISDEERILFEKVLYTFVFLISTMGVTTNAINIRVFINQGLSGHSSTISLFSLAISDLGACMALVVIFACTILDFLSNFAAQYSCYNILEIPGQYTHLVFARLTSWITAYISIERGMSVLMPLKVKTIFRPKMTAIVIACLTLIILCAHYGYPLVTIVWMHHPAFNTTVAESFVADEWVQSMFVQSIIFEAVSPSIVLAFVIPSLVLIIATLKRSRKFRQASTAASSQEEDKLSKDKKGKNRENEILKAVVIVWGVYIFCQIMNFVPSIASAVLPEVYLRGLNENIIYVSYIYKFVFDVINSSTNMFIYITVSSSYKAAFKRVFYRRDATSSKRV